MAAGVPPDGAPEVLERCARAALAAILRHYPEAVHVGVLAATATDSLGVRLAQLLRPWRRVSLIPVDAPVSAWEPALRCAHLLVDATSLEGRGTEWAVRGAQARLLNSVPVPLLALGMPGGVDGDTGWVEGEALRADATLALLGLRPAHCTGRALEFRGTLLFDAAGSEPLTRELAVFARRYGRREAPALPSTAKTAHKGSAGRLLLIAGGPGLAGAAVLGAHAAVTAGIGLLRIVTHQSHTSSLTIRVPEALVLDADHWGGVSADAVDAIAIGSGLLPDAWGLRLWHAALSVGCPLVVDAGALRLLADHPERRSDWILTPHPGEAAALLGTDVHAIERDRWGAAAAIVDRYGGVCILKGAGTILAAQGRMEVCDHGNPALAIGGSGDMLTGCAGALYARGLDAWAAAAVAVAVHGRAGEDLAQQCARGHHAEDLIAAMRTELCAWPTASESARCGW